MSIEVDKATREQLEKLTEAYRDARGAHDAHRDRWQAAITAAVDAGMRPADVGRIVGVSPQRVIVIVARTYGRTDAGADL